MACKKIKHATAAAADERRVNVAEYNRRRGIVRPEPAPEVYFCDQCQAYHFGRPKRQPQTESDPCTTATP
jgi:hypothetical protein